MARRSREIGGTANCDDAREQKRRRFQTTSGTEILQNHHRRHSKHYFKHSHRQQLIIILFVLAGRHAKQVASAHRERGNELEKPTENEGERDRSTQRETNRPGNKKTFAILLLNFTLIFYLPTQKKCEETPQIEGLQFAYQCIEKSIPTILTEVLLCCANR